MVGSVNFCPVVVICGEFEDYENLDVGENEPGLGVRIVPTRKIRRLAPLPLEMVVTRELKSIGERPLVDPIHIIQKRRVIDSIDRME